MLRLGVDRAWIAKECDYKSGSLAQILAPNGNQKYKTDKALRRIWEALDREEERQKSVQSAKPSKEPASDQIVLNPDDTEYQAWCSAFKVSDAADFKEWIIHRLNDAAAKALAVKSGISAPLAALPDALSTPEPLNVTPMPFYGLVAAGTPAGAIDDMLDETAHVPGRWPAVGHFALRVSGRSMEPDYPDGSTIVCRKLKPGEYPSKGMDVIAFDRSGAYFKRLAYSKSGPKGTSPRKPVPHLVSINPAFPEVVPAADCPVTAIVVGKA